jgi:hypothetical protein
VRLGGHGATQVLEVAELLPGEVGVDVVALGPSEVLGVVELDLVISGGENGEALVVLLLGDLDAVLRLPGVELGGVEAARERETGSVNNCNSYL